ncbi:uncharacterized protein LOC114332582 isoform X1 [Diabrotica virgifera virgifera]|uniref:Uncharacterized protein LOC114332582 isoform X1 n=1 Tax=Diabrotica virgifera virgifera TaxID=50390 RepID=A0A6P7FPR1_DIAVI|nr:uncharacterized protein LOC114332582 isoform X1 [Diabrotica virgifera virgifera]
MDDPIKYEEQAQVQTIPLFIKKLWKMVNDVDSDNIISWNVEGDSFIIHDQLQFIIKLLPHYFKHNNMASFVRQLNFYNFHKVPSVNNEVQFSHECFIKDMPEVLSYIRRKNPVVKQKAVPNFKEQEVQGLLKDVKSLKGKHSLVDKELAMLKQENLALWTELNSLRVKYTKQSTIINMLIHFLITYIHSHQTAFTKQNIDASSSPLSRNNIKVGPQLLEIGYKNPKKSPAQNPYTVLQPGTSDSVTYSLELPETCGPEVKRQRISPKGLNDLGFPGMSSLKKPGITYSIKLPSQAEKLMQPDIPRSLLEILKQNEQLCEDESDDICSNLQAAENLIHLKEEPADLQEDMMTDDDADTDNYYTVSYPSEAAKEVILEEQTAAESPHDGPIIESAPESVVDQGTQVFSPSEIPVIISQEVPVKTPSGKTNLTISYPNSPNVNQTSNKKKIKVFDHVFIPNKQTLLKGTSKLKSTVTAPKSGKVLPSKGVASKLTRRLSSQSQSSDIEAAEGTLLEILKENEKLSKDNIKNPTIANYKRSNLGKIINSDANMGKSFDDYFITDTGATELLGSETQSKNQPVPESQTKSQRTVPGASNASSVSNNNANFKILESPKEHFSSYVSNTQEEIDMLQDILNNLTSNDLSGILANQAGQLSDEDISAINEEIEHEKAVDDMPVEELDDDNRDEDVDKYFKTHFLDLDNV